MKAAQRNELCWPVERRAFTLLELLVVLTIASLLAGLVGLSLRGHFQQAVLARAIDQIVEADRLARQLAMTNPARTLGLQWDTQRLRISINGGQRAIQLAQKIELGELRQLDTDGWTTARDSIAFANNGTSPTYAVRLSAGAASKWLVVFGLSGQARVFEREEVLTELLR